MWKYKRLKSPTDDILLVHWIELRASGINHKTAVEAGIYSDGKEVLYFPYPGTEGFNRYKLFNSLTGEAGYRQKKNSPVRLYISDKVRPKLKDVKIPLTITEGEKKTLKACQEDFDCIGIGGVWSWAQNKKPIPDLDLINWQDREIRYIPDSDIWQKVDCMQAVYALGNELRYRGAKVEIIKLLPCKEGKVGLDDYLLYHDSSQLDKLPRVDFTDPCFDAIKPWYRTSDWYRIIIADGIIDSQDIPKLKLRERKTLLSPWLKEQSLGLISAARGVGKTWFATAIIQAITTGGSFSKWRAEKPAKCAFLDAEMVITDIDERLQKLPGRKPKHGMFLMYSSDYATALDQHMPSLADNVWRKAVQQWLIRNKIKVWVIDNISSVAGDMDENTTKDWGPIKRWLIELRFAGISTILIHHTGKDEKAGPRGTSSREDNLDYSIILRKPKDYDESEDGCRFIVDFTKKRIERKHLDSIAPVEMTLQEHKDKPFTWVFSDVKKKSKKDILKLLDSGMKQSDIARELNVSRVHVSKVKKKAQQEGFLDEQNKLTIIGHSRI